MPKRSLTHWAEMDPDTRPGLPQEGQRRGIDHGYLSPRCHIRSCLRHGSNAPRNGRTNLNDLLRSIRRLQLRDQSALTDQERRCLELMVEGQSTVKIAREMEIRLEEAQALEAAVIQKFGTNNRFQAVAKAVLLGIVKT